MCIHYLATGISCGSGNGMGCKRAGTVGLGCFVHSHNSDSSRSTVRFLANLDSFFMTKEKCRQGNYYKIPICRTKTKPCIIK